MSLGLALLLSGCGAGGAVTGNTGGPVMVVTGTEDLNAFGTVGTTFQPDSVTCAVGNTGTALLTWEAVSSVDWVTITPASGILQPQETVSVEVALNVNATALPVGTHSGLVEVHNLTNGVGDTSRSVSLTATGVTSQSMAAASRQTGVAPLAVTFDATAPTSGVAQPGGALPDFGSYAYEWTYGDLESGTWAHNGKSKNVSVGWIGAHVFERPGTYRVSLRVTQDDGTSTEHHQDIVVEDPDTVFANRTYYVAANGLDTNPGTSALPFQTIGRGFTAAFGANLPTRVLFRRGDTFSTTTHHQAPNNGTAAVLIGAYGSGAKPVLQFASQHGGMNLASWVDARLVDLHLVANGTNMLTYARGVSLGTRCTVLRCTVQDFGYALDASHVNDATVAECEVLDSVEYGLWTYSADLQTGNRIAALGNRFDQAGYHLTRAYVNRSLFQANLYQRAHFTAMALVGRNAGTPPTQLNCIIDNVYTTETGDVIAMGPVNAQFNEYARDYLFEGNRWISRAESGNCLHIRGSRVTVRNNVFDLAGRTAVDVSPWAGSPVPAPSDVRVEHNTAYRHTGSPLRFLTSQSSNPTIARNNLFFCRQGTANAPTGSLTLANNLSTDPRFVDPASGDFLLQAGSPAIDAGTSTNVRVDFRRTARSQGNAPDLGAFEMSN